MRPSRTILLAVLIALAIPRPGWAADPAPTARAHASKKSVDLGAPFQVVITVDHDASVKVNLPADIPGGNFLQIDREESTRDLGGGRSRLVVELRVSALKVGDITFPKIPVSYVAQGVRKQVDTNPVPIHVRSVVGAGKGTLKPITPPVAVIQDDYTLAWVAAGVVLLVGLLAAGWLFLRRRRRRPKSALAEMDVDPRPPYQIALDELTALLDSHLIHQEDRRPLYFLASEILRVYLGRRFGFDALELTSSELLESLDRTAGGFAARQDVEAWVSDCDLVKYARVPATRADAQTLVERAIAIVSATRPREPEAEPSTAASQPAAGDTVAVASADPADKEGPRA